MSKEKAPPSYGLPADGGFPVELVIARGTSAAVGGWILPEIVEFLGDHVTVCGCLCEYLFVQRIHVVFIASLAS